ncbi:hypothetical protein F0L68_05535, partial [Solihabitans fulvus]
MLSPRCQAALLELGVARTYRHGEVPLRETERSSHVVGTLAAGDFGLVGNAPIVACRLLDANVVRRARVCQVF